MKRSVHFFKKISPCGPVFGLCFLAMVLLCGTAHARDPFLAPRPPLEVYDFPRAVEDIELRGLLLMEDRFRALVYVQSQRSFRVLNPMDRLEVTLAGLRHEFTVEGMGARRLVLRGADNERYEIGAAQRD